MIPTKMPLGMYDTKCVEDTLPVKKGNPPYSQSQAGQIFSILVPNYADHLRSDPAPTNVFFLKIFPNLPKKKKKKAKEPSRLLLPVTRRKFSFSFSFSSRPALSLSLCDRKNWLYPNAQKKGAGRKKIQMAKGGRDYGDSDGGFGRLTGSGSRLGLLTPIRMSGGFGASDLGTNGLSGVCTPGR